jgi:hypothetical protein
LDQRNFEHRSPAEIVYEFEEEIDDGDICDDDNAGDGNDSDYERELNSTIWSLDRAEVDTSGHPSA